MSRLSHITPSQNRASIIQLASTTIPRREELHLFLKFSALALPVNEPCELFFFIYDASMSKMIRYEWGGKWRGGRVRSMGLGPWDCVVTGLCFYTVPFTCGFVPVFTD